MDIIVMERYDHILDIVKDMRPEASDSVCRLMSYGRMYEAVYNMVAVTHGEDAPELASFGIMVKSLTDTMTARYRSTSNDTDRARLLCSIFGLINGTSTVVDDAMSSRWYDAADSLIGKYAGYVAVVQADSQRTWLCRCIIDYLYFMSYDEDDPYFTFLKDAAGSWASSYTDGNGWDGVPAEEALGRIEVMDRISYMLLRHDWEHIAEDAYRHYMGAVESMKPLPLSLLGLLYDLQESHAMQSMEGNFRSVTLTGNEILSYGRKYPDGSDERLYAMSYYIKSLCRKEIRAFEEEMELIAG